MIIPAVFTKVKFRDYLSYFGCKIFAHGYVFSISRNKDLYLYYYTKQPVCGSKITYMRSHVAKHYTQFTCQWTGSNA